MNEPTEWSFEPAPRVTGWFAVLRGWDPEEGLFPGAAWATDGVFNDSGIGNDGSSGHAGPFPTEAAATRWAEAHDPEGLL